MERVELERVVARAIIGAIWRDNPEVRDATEVQGEELLWAAAAIRVVVAEAARSIEALPTTGATYMWRRVPGSVDLIDRDAALAVLAGLVPQPPV